MFRETVLVLMSYTFFFLILNNFYIVYVFLWDPGLDKSPVSLARRKRQLNFRMRPKKPKPRVTEGVVR